MEDANKLQESLLRQTSDSSNFVRTCFEFLSNTLHSLDKPIYTLRIQSEATPEDLVLIPNLEISRKLDGGEQRISVSCIWKIQRERKSDTGYANFLGSRYAKVIAITAEASPMNLPILVWGTPGLDCVYHSALPELKSAIGKSRNEDQMDMLANMIEGNRLRDISDLPFDLAA
jgi:hypothetical protein